MTGKPSTRQLPHGPDESVVLDVNEESFIRIGKMCAEYGDIFQLKSPSRSTPTIVINHPEYIKRVLVTNYKNDIKGIGFERVKMLLGDGIIVSDGEHWRTQRRMIQPSFSKTIIAHFAEMMRQCNSKMLQRWQSKSARGEKINITEETSMLSLEIILRSIFSDDLDAIIAAEGKNPFAVLVYEAERNLQFAVRFRAFTKLVKQVMEQRQREQREENDLLSAMMAARDKESGQPMSEKSLIDEVMTMIVAGHETTAATLNWSWYLVATHPEVAEKLYQEVDALHLDGPPTFEQLPQLSYTKQIMDEALRLYPPVWLFTRRALQEDWLGEYYVPQGADIVLSPYYVHRHKAFWSEPEKFNPERFNQQSASARDRYAYFPFSMGARRCIGEFFSAVEVQIHLGLMARHLHLSYLPDRPVELEPLINLRTKHDLFMTVEPRRN